MRRLILPTALAVPPLLLLAAGTAAADPLTRTGGSSEHGDVGAAASAQDVTFDESDNGDGGPLTTTARNWSPPPCWYAPRWNPDQLNEFAEEAWDPSTETGTAASALGWMWNHYDSGEPYTDFNAEEAGNGMWWGPVENPSEPDLLERTSCSEIPFWVENGVVPDVENALSPQVLAELAYERIRVPDTEVTFSPAALDGQVVNLPTWVWAESGDYDQVAVTATLESWDIWATTTARPTALTIEPGTPDAETHPASGSCPINEDGSIGTPYPAGDGDGEDAIPPCGLTYLRATHDAASYPLTASITWSIAWEGSGGTGGTLPDATFATTHEVQVNEIQSIVRP
ncbi:hypothetical protein FH609_012815 [Streptomyces sp. 3MP-14]|uniref:Enoyl reductase n=1 Tax=Streptomyces mimosae TaxID=2586635 RepID=A0A5N6AEK7_9ACTN|nr:MULTISPECIES: hypothetical protein [Streptomyces]KAB8167254.1 hypothetical protein FH607_010265 [Streptomyces mimosae]KAB8177194.1 hypothetical protein FH609_012815 [Streptomyces sp. 3MP-14]